MQCQRMMKTLCYCIHDLQKLLHPAPLWGRVLASCCCCCCYYLSLPPLVGFTGGQVWYQSPTAQEYGTRTWKCCYVAQSCWYGMHHSYVLQLRIWQPYSPVLPVVVVVVIVVVIVVIIIVVVYLFCIRVVVTCTWQ